MVLGELLQPPKGKKIYTLNYMGKAFIEAETQEEALEKFHNGNIKSREETVIGEIAIVVNKEVP